MSDSLQEKWGQGKVSLSLSLNMGEITEKKWPSKGEIDVAGEGGLLETYSLAMN